jgi:hypothetical protein
LLEDNLKLAYSEYSIDKSSRRFREILGENLMYPENSGYMLAELKLDQDNKVISVSAKAGDYGQNIDTSHILEYELTKVYSKSRDKVSKSSSNDLLRFFPIRAKIHRGRTLAQVLTQGTDRASLIGVQVFILFKDPDNDQYKTLLIERSDKVTIKPEYHQFIPSGGFEVWGDKKSSDITLEDNFSLKLALFREYLEEVFGIKDFELNAGGHPEINIINHEKTQLLLGEVTKQPDCFQFLGSVVDLVTLRHELSFILRIDSPQFAAQTFYANHESKKLHIVSLDKLETRLQGKKLNQGSAALFHLASRHPLYTEAINGKVS